MSRRSVDLYIGASAAVGSALGALAGVMVGWPELSAVIDFGLLLAISGGVAGVVAGAVMHFLGPVLGSWIKGPQVPTDGPEADYHDLRRLSPPPDPRP
jgi:branched-subunit amino acid ABC-type transport system permease component